MKNAMFLGMLTLAVALGSCNQKANTPKAEDKVSSDPKPVNIQVSDLAVNKDLNCDMPLSSGEIMDTTTYKGKVYGFCSKDCKDAFLKDPEALINKK